MREVRVRPVTVAIIIAAAVVVSGVGAWYLFNEMASTQYAKPTCDLIQEDESAPVFMIMNLAGTWGTPWDDTQVRMLSEPNDPETYLSVNFWWQPDQDNLTSEDGVSVTQSLLLYDNTDLELVCNITDVTGNGLVDDGDYFTLVPVGEHSLMPGVIYEVFLLYVGGMTTMASLEFAAPDY